MALSIKSDHLSFEHVTPTTKCIQLLYDLLKVRIHSISHFKMPTFDEHALFVKNHPYRAWFFVNFKGECIGSVYIAFDNTVGVNVLDVHLS